MTTLTQLRKLAEAATPGPWRRDKTNVNRVENSCAVCTVCYTRCASDAEYFATLQPHIVLAMIEVIEAAKAMREAGVDLSLRCIEPPYMSEKAAVNEMIGIFDGPLQRSFDAALAKLEQEQGR